MMTTREQPNPRVLFVDDNRDLVEYTCRRLRARKLKVSIANDGEEAIEVLQRERFDVVVLDILMPGMDGIETLREIKKLDPSVQVVLLTGHGNEKTAATGKELGALDYLLKPTDLGTLLEAIERAFGESYKAKSKAPKRLKGSDVTSTSKDREMGVE